jgi:hypothetical protein
VQRQPVLWIMPITSTLFALLHGVVALLAGAAAPYRALGPLARAQLCGAACRLVFSAVAAASALLLAAAAPWTLLPQPSPLQGRVAAAASAARGTLPRPLATVASAVGAAPGAHALLAAAAAAAAPVAEACASAAAAATRAAQHLAASQQQQGLAAGAAGVAGDGAPESWVQLPATVLCCFAAGYYALRLWQLVRSRAANLRGVALLQYTLLLVVYGVSSYKGSQVALCAVALGCEAAGVPAAAGKVLDLLAAGGRAAAAGTTAAAGRVPRAHGGLRGGVLLLERLMFPAFRVLPQALLTVLVVLSSAAFTHPAYYSLAVAGMCLCHVLNVLKAASIYGGGGGKASSTAAHARRGARAAAAALEAAAVSQGVAYAAAGAGASSSSSSKQAGGDDVAAASP